MAGTLTVTPDPNNAPPRFLLQVTGAAGSTVTLTRTNADGSTYLLRAANPVDMVSGAWSGYDYESPFNTGGTYSYATDTGETGSAAAVPLREWGVQDPWLIHPGIPDLSVKLAGATLGDQTQDTLQGSHVVLDRAAPVIVTDGQRHAPTFQLTCKAYSKAADDALRAILDDSSPLLLNYVQPFTDLADYYWVSIASTTRHRITQSYAVPYFLWTLPCTVVDAPSGLLQSQWTWADVLANYATWADVSAAYATWNDVLINNPS